MSIHFSHRHFKFSVSTEHTAGWLTDMLTEWYPDDIDTSKEYWAIRNLACRTISASDRNVHFRFHASRVGQFVDWPQLLIPKALAPFYERVYVTRRFHVVQVSVIRRLPFCKALPIWNLRGTQVSDSFPRDTGVRQAEWLLKVRFQITKILRDTRVSDNACFPHTHAACYAYLFLLLG
jgi:hypothetical protein